jgi:tetratricopeptide (TPR) repeat protein
MSYARGLCGVAFLALAGWLMAPVVILAAPQGDEAIERLRFEAVQLEQDGDLEGALQKYALLSEQFLEAPAAAEALLRLVVGYRDLGRGEEAEGAAQTLIRSHPRSPHAAGGYAVLGQLQADRAGDTTELDEARVTLENAVLLFPRATYAKQPWRAEAAVRGARVALRLGRDAEAAHALADVIDLEPRSLWTASARFELAGLLLDQGDWLEAAGLLQGVVRDAGEGDEERALAALAEGRLALAHRLGLRPESGQQRWQRSRVVNAAPERPSAVAARLDGQVAVTGAKGSTVVVDATGKAVSRWSHEEAQHNSWRGTELAVATNEAAATFPERRSLRFASPPSDKKPTVRPLVAVEPAPFRRWLVLAGKPPRVLLYEPERRQHETLVAGKGREPVDLASDRRGRLLVLDQKARSVTRFTAGDPNGERLVAGGWDRAAALAVDEMGNIYVLDRGRRRIEMFDRGGERLVGLGPSLPGGLEMQRPADLTVDGAGRIWIADSKLGLIVLE